MDPVKPAVETPVQPAAPVQPAVETPAPSAAPAPQDDLVAQLAAKDNEIKRLAEEKENYRLGLLKAKGKIPDDQSGLDDQQLSVDSKIQKAVQDALYSEKEKKLMAEKEAILQQALKENREMKVALGNKQGITTTGDGTSSDNKTTTPQFFSDEQIKDLKSRGWSDEKIKTAAENIQAKR